MRLPATSYCNPKCNLCNSFYFRKTKSALIKMASLWMFCAVFLLSYSTQLQNVLAEKGTAKGFGSVLIM